MGEKIRTPRISLVHLRSLCYYDVNSWQSRYLFDEGGVISEKKTDFIAHHTDIGIDFLFTLFVSTRCKAIPALCIGDVFGNAYFHADIWRIFHYLQRNIFESYGADMARLVVLIYLWRGVEWSIFRYGQ